MRIISDNEINRLIEKIEKASESALPTNLNIQKTYTITLSGFEYKTLIDALRFFAGAS